MDRARIVCGPLGPEKGACVAAELVRDRKPLESVPEDRDETVVGRVEAVEPVGDRPAQRLEQAEVVESPEAARREPPQLGDDPLSRGPGDEGGVLPHQPFGLLVEAEAELVLEPDGPKQPERVVREDGVADRAEPLRLEVVAPAERIDRLAAAERARDRVDGEVARGEVVLDRSGSGGSSDNGDTTDPGSGVKSTVRPCSSATRQAPCRSESGKGAPPDRRA